MPGERIVSIQILRLFAAAMVVIAHQSWFHHAIRGVDPSGAWGLPMQIGSSGVDIFFVVSGFIVSRAGPLAETTPNGWAFAWRRWRRVAPLYFLIATPMIVLAGAHGQLRADRFAATFLFLPLPVGPYLVQGWTLCFEMVFYLSMSALLLAGGAVRRNLMLALAVAGALALAGWLNPIYLEFAAGVLIARLEPRVRSLGAAAGLAFLAAGLAALAADVAFRVIPFDETAVLLGHDWPRVLVFGLPAMAIVIGALTLEPRTPGRLADVLSRGGDASYSIYLCHTYAISIVTAAWIALRLSSPAVDLVGFVAAMGMGVAVYGLVERPLLRDLKRLPWRPLALGDEATPVS
jgi:exopolysaccharide production protein ExoZ